MEISIFSVVNIRDRPDFRNFRVGYCFTLNSWYKLDFSLFFPFFFFFSSYGESLHSAVPVYKIDGPARWLFYPLFQQLMMWAERSSILQTRGNDRHPSTSGSISRFRRQTLRFLLFQKITPIRLRKAKKTWRRTYESLLFVQTLKKK